MVVMEPSDIDQGVALEPRPPSSSGAVWLVVEHMTEVATCRAGFIGASTPCHVK